MHDIIRPSISFPGPPMAGVLLLAIAQDRCISGKARQARSYWPFRPIMMRSALWPGLPKANISPQLVWIKLSMSLKFPEEAFRLANARERIADHHVQLTHFVDPGAVDESTGTCGRDLWIVIEHN